MSDLISRKAVYEMLHGLGGCDATDEWADGWDKGINQAISDLDDIPVAYDVDKVVEQLKECERYVYDAVSDEDNYVIDTEKAIEIMKGTVRGNDIEKAIEILKRKTTIPNKDESWTDIDKAYDAAISALEAQQTNSWVPVTERLPEAEKEVEVTIERRMKNKTFRFTCRAFYEDGTIWSEDSGYCWGNFDDAEYDEEHGDYKISKGWFEAVTYAEEFRAIDDFVIAWRPVPEPWREEKC